MAEIDEPGPQSRPSSTDSPAASKISAQESTMQTSSAQIYGPRDSSPRHLVMEQETVAVSRCVHELFEEQVDRAPGATALLAGAERLSYAELDERAQRLARRLQDAGAGRGTLVGICLERSTELVIATLATLKAGAGYLMLDPDFPAARLRDMAGDAGTVAIVSRTREQADAIGSAAQFVSVDCDGVINAGRVAGGARPGDVACVMFTSGSTGRPKTVAAPHSAIVGTLAGQDYAPFDAGTVWLQCAPVSWDAFVLELWGALLFGGTCVLYPAQRPDAVVIARLVAEHRVTSMYLSSSLFNVIVDEYPDALTGLRNLIVGGEAPSPVHARRAMDHLPQLRLHNGYGPVETMVFATTHPIAAADTAQASIPIGRPLVGKQVHVLDDLLRPVAVGEVGELYAAGVGLAHGYLGRPAATAERFVANPFGQAGELMYRTGDLVRRRPDGRLEFTGRADAQIKIRGFRVEPAEVESALARHPDVERVALAAQERRGSRILVAYVVARSGSGEPAAIKASLRALVEASLPEFMTPSAYVLLDALPLTANGKLDRAALPSPESAGRVEQAVPNPITGSATGPLSSTFAGLAIGPRAPRTAGEKVLCELFAEVLDLPEVGVDDSFFILGGDSIRVARLLSRIHLTLGAEIGVRAVFETPTVADLAKYLDHQGPDETGAGTAGVSGLGVASSEGRPLSFAQRRLWFLDQIDAGAAYTTPLLVRLRGEVDPEALRAALADLLQRHDALRTVFTIVDGEPVQRVLSGDEARPAFTVVQVGAAEMDARIAEAARHRFDLRTEMPFYALLCTENQDPHKHALLLIMHHIAVDGWSLAPLMRDLSLAYAARCEGVQPDLPPLPIQYADYAGQQRERLGDPDDPNSTAGRQLQYWRETLAGLPDGLALPRRTGRAGAPGTAARTVVRRLSADLHGRLVGLARERRTTLFMVLHAGLAVVLDRMGAGTDVAVGTPVAGRGGAPVDDLVGFFVNMVVLRADLSGDPAVRDLLARVRETDLDALGHQDVPFEWVVREHNPDRTSGRRPLLEVVLALQNNMQAELSFPGVESRAEVLRTGEARFELLVDATDEYAPNGAPQGIALTVEYQVEVFEAPVMEWLADAFTGVLDAMAETPNARIGSLTAKLPQPPWDEAATAAFRPLPRPSAESGFAAPRTDLEQRLAAVWADVLGLDRVGVHDNFFVLGGDSLEAVRTAARIVTAERLPATAAGIFAAPTVAELAVALADPAARAVAPIPRASRVPRGRAADKA
jgi:nonribosomal peptide synthetase DhbF